MRLKPHQLMSEREILSVKPDTAAPGRRRLSPRACVLPGVAQPRRDAIDGNMDPALNPLVSLARAVAANQFHLQVVQRINLGKAVANRALQRGVAGQTLALTGDLAQRAHCTVPFGLDHAENLFSQARVGHQFGIT